MVLYGASYLSMFKKILNIRQELRTRRDDRIDATHFARPAASLLRL